MFSLAGTLDAMRPHLPGALVSADAFEHARTAVDHLEAEITNGIYFECRLRNGSSRVDLVIAVHADGAALLADANGSGPRGCRHAQPGGRRLSAFCRRWTTPTSPLRTLVDHVWLEYDVEQGGFADEAARSGPGVFCSLRGSHGMAHPAPALRRSVTEALEALTGHQASRTVQECLHTCFTRLPAETGVPHVGLMFGRDAPTVRICIAKLPAAGAADLLAATAGVGGGDLAEITRLASLPDGPGEPLYVPMLHLDIDEQRGFVPPRRDGTAVRPYVSAHRPHGSRRAASPRYPDCARPLLARKARRPPAVARKRACDDAARSLVERGRTAGQPREVRLRTPFRRRDQGLSLRETSPVPRAASTEAPNRHAPEATIELELLVIAVDACDPIRATEGES